jgi:glutamate-1-semialdehyde 2,1-aminomutase
MNLVAPLGPVYQAGTLSGNPLAMRAGIETLKLLRAPGFYEALNAKSERLVKGLREALLESETAGTVSAVKSLATLFFAPRPVRNYEDAKLADRRRYAGFFSAMLDQGVFLAPSQFEAMFVSAAHSDEDIVRTISAARASLKRLA